MLAHADTCARQAHDPDALTVGNTITEALEKMMEHTGQDVDAFKQQHAWVGTPRRF